MDVLLDLAFPDHIQDLRNLALGFHDLGVLAVTNRILGLTGFRLCTGSVGAGKHHARTGGLQRHTWEVVTLCLNAHQTMSQAAAYPSDSVDSRTLFLAALAHDMGKVYDYEWGQDGWRSAPHRRLVNHMNRSAIEWTHIARGKVDKTIEEDVLHAILAHHGDYGSSLLSKTRVAWILHTCDQMSARLNDADTLDLSKRQ